MPSLPKHRARAVEQIAAHRCSTDLTDGFCGPRDGKCFWQGLNEHNQYRSCMVQAEGIMRAMETRGVSVVWDHDPSNHPDPIVNAAELAAIRGL
jgi:hypothetical protein